ncbi:hypothetical protein EAO69_29490 [Streptomyces sp. me109]|nr:hypothetical protein EAO69_29490 [Streptomyces sp. me109]
MPLGAAAPRPPHRPGRPRPQAPDGLLVPAGAEKAVADVAFPARARISSASGVEDEPFGRRPGTR